jgi:2,3-dihydroxyphenylpropionate 1,2-dioxygenase
VSGASAANSTWVMLGCVSHSPIIMVRKRKPEVEDRIVADCVAFRARVEAFDPDFVVMFSNDHFAGFHYANMPAFCIGTACEAVPDVGGTPGHIPVPADLACSLVEHLRGSGFDPAISYRMRVDHGFSQPLSRLLGAIDRWPLIPIFISAFTRPLTAFGRSRCFGRSVGQFVASLNRRVLILGSGGLSHHPLRYYPTPEEADPAVYGWQLDGEAAGTMTEAEWFHRLEVMHHEGAEMVMTGRRTIADMRLNPEFDTGFLNRIAEDSLEEMDSWNQDEVVAKAGIGALEIHNWIAARAAFTAAGGRSVETHYDLVPDYAVGYALAIGR